jgi:O-antigen ligase
MTTAGFAFLVLSCAAIAAIFFVGTRNPLNAISLLLISLPILSLSRKAFNDTAFPFPSLETVAVIVLWLGVLLGRKKNKPISIIARRGITLLIVFLCTALLSTINSDNWGLSARIVLAGVVSPCICYYVAAKYIKTFDDRYRIVLAFIIMGFIAFLYSTINMQNLAVLAGGVLDIDAYRWFYNEAPVVNFFVVPSTAVAAIVPIIPLGIWYWKHGLRYRVPVFLAALLSGTFICLLSLSRGSWLTMVVAVIFSFWALYRARSVFLFPVVAIGLAAVVYLNADELVAPLLESRLQGGVTASDSNFVIRFDNYLITLRAGFLHPLFGVGLGSYAAIYEELNIAVFSPLWFGHSLFLTLIPEIGVVGTVAFVIFFGQHIISAFKWRSVSQSEVDLGRAIGIGLLAIILVASTSGCHLISYLLPDSDSTYFIAPVMIIAFSLMGIIAGRNNNSKITPQVYPLQQPHSHDK